MITGRSMYSKVLGAIEGGSSDICFYGRVGRKPDINFGSFGKYSIYLKQDVGENKDFSDILEACIFIGAEQREFFASHNLKDLNIVSDFGVRANLGMDIGALHDLLKDEYVMAISVAGNEICCPIDSFVIDFDSFCNKSVSFL